MLRIASLPPFPKTRASPDLYLPGLQRGPPLCTGPSTSRTKSACALPAYPPIQSCSRSPPSSPQATSLRKAIAPARKRSPPGACRPARPADAAALARRAIAPHRSRPAPPPPAAPTGSRSPLLPPSGTDPPRRSASAFGTPPAHAGTCRPHPCMRPMASRQCRAPPARCSGPGFRTRSAAACCATPRRASCSGPWRGRR